MTTSVNAAVLIFMTGRNCQEYVTGALESLASQTFRDVHVLLIDDCSDDETAAAGRDALQRLFPDRHTLVVNESRFGKARNAWEHLRPRAANAEFVAVLDADDQLVDQTILARMHMLYQQGRDVVWTNYITDNGMIGGNGPLNPDLSPRQQGWKTSHFFSFRASLLSAVPKSYFQDAAGEWLPAACDIAIAFPILDQTRRYEYIPVNAYRYTSSNPQSHHNLDPQSAGLNSAIQQRCAQEIARKQPLALTRPVLQPAKITPKPVPAKKPVSNTPANLDIVEKLAAEALAQRCPELLDAIAFCGPSQMRPLQLWAIRKILESAGPQLRILHVGMPRSALALAALAQQLGGHVVALAASEVEAQELLMRAQLSGLEEALTVVATQVVEASFGDVTAPFPDTRVLGSDIKFEMVVVDLPSSLPQGSALVSLTMVAEWLSRQKFFLCLFSQDREVEAFVMEKWQAVTTGMSFSLNSVGGSGLIVRGGRP